jgi:predicted DNA-binding transcriptional regulator AlpA
VSKRRAVMKRMLSFNQLKLKLGDGFYSRDHLRRKCRAGEFPKPIHISDRKIAWDEQEIDNWLEERAGLREIGTGAGAA